MGPAIGDQSEGDARHGSTIWHVERLSVTRLAYRDEALMVGVADDLGDVVPDALLDLIEPLRGRPRSITELGGGLTNRNFKVTTPEASYVVRVSSRESVELSVNREHEYRNSIIAADAGVGAPVVGYLPDHGVMVVGFLEGETFTDASFATPGAVARVAAACRRLHGGGRFVNEFNMFEIQARYLTLVRERGYRLPAGYLDFADQLVRVHRALGVRAEPLVACNNDLLAGNFIDQGAQIRIIDYEYAGNNDACFELGNIWSECHLSDEQLEELLEAYYGRISHSKLARARLQGLMSQYGWTLWASIQASSSALDFDFWTWGLEKYERAAATFRSPELDELLDAVQRDD
jgi:thiamine kinase-like enzyme